MKFQDALLAGPDHGTDRMPVEIDRRLRRRLGLEAGRAAASTHRVWLRPAIAAFAVAAAVVVVIIARPTHTTDPAQRAAVGFVDVSKARWSGTVTGSELDVRADSPASAMVTWTNAAIVAAPGTRLSTTAAGSLVLAHGAIQIQRTETKPVSVVVPIGRVVIGAYHSSVTAERASVTILLDDGSGSFVDAQGQTHALVPGAALVWPPAAGEPEGTSPGPDESVPGPVAPARKRASGRGNVAPAGSESLPEEQGPPGLTPPIRRPDVPCTFKSDCDEGQTCRENERRESVCMGNGLEGAACWFDSDCESQHCAQRRCASTPGAR